MTGVIPLLPLGLSVTNYLYFTFCIKHGDCIQGVTGGIVNILGGGSVDLLSYSMEQGPS
jgi:hypothetical protein